MMMIMMMTRLVLLLTLLLLPISGSNDVFGDGESCDVQTFEQSIAIQFASLPDSLDADQITFLEQTFKTTYNALTSCTGDSLRDVVNVDIEIVVEQRRHLQFNWGFYLDWRVLLQCRGCEINSRAFGNDASRRSLAQETSGLSQDRSLQDTPCPPCDTPTTGDFIASYNIALHEYALTNNPDNIIGDAVSVVEIEESLAHSVCGSLAVHAETTISFNGEPTTIHSGDVSLSPGTSVTGAYQLQGGGILVEESNAFAAKVATSHAEAMAVRNDGTAIVVEIGGITFTPGTYRSGSAINIAYGSVVILDGEGDPNSVFLFQAGTTLITGASTSVILTNGARAENVVWALGTAATLGASSVLEGSILAGTAITFGTKSELNGCALAQSAVTFESQGSIKLLQ